MIAIASAASVKMNPLWRRRVRTLVVTILLMMVAFAGSMGTVFTFVVALLGLIFGQLLWGKDRIRNPAVNRGPQDGRALVALMVVGVVVGTLVSLQSPQMIGVLASLRYTVSPDAISKDMVDQICHIEGLEAQCRQYEYLYANEGIGSRILAMMPLFVQLVLAVGLRGGRRAAWAGTMLLQSMTVTVGVVALLVVGGQVGSWTVGAEALGFTENGQPSARLIVPILVPLILLVIVGTRRNLFIVTAKTGVYRRLWRHVAIVSGITLAITWVIGLLINATDSFLSTIWILFSDFVIRLLPSSVLSIVTPQMTEESAAAVELMGWMPIIPWLAMAVGLWGSFSQRFLPGRISRREYLTLVQENQAGSLGWLGTWEGNDYWGSTKYRAGIAYRSQGNVALTVGDPACLESDLEAVVEEFVSFCNNQGLIPAFYSVHQPLADLTEKWGWISLQVAQETRLILSTLEFKGKKFQGIRTALNRAEKEGISTLWTTFAKCRPAIRAQIMQISSQWVDDKPLPEMGFTLGGIKELDDPEVKLLLAVDEQGTVHGVTSWMPIYEQGIIQGWTLDFMRRLNDGFRPVMEYLIASAALWAKAEGYQVISLSGAPLAKAETGSSEVDRETVFLDQILDFLGNTLEPVYGFRSLLVFKAKFRPEYEPLYLTLPTIAGLPSVGVAISHAYIPDLNLTETLRIGMSLRRK